MGKNNKMGKKKVRWVRFGVKKDEVMKGIFAYLILKPKDLVTDESQQVKESEWLLATADLLIPSTSRLIHSGILWNCLGIS